jgi:hypothetical protein
MAKNLYEFTVEKEVIEKVESTVDNPDGTQTKTIEDVKAKKPFKFAIRKPNRIMFEEADLHYGIWLSKYFKSGLMTIAQMRRIYDNDGGVINDEDKKALDQAFIDLKKIQEDYQAKKIVSDLDPASEESKKDVDDLFNKYVQVRQLILSLQSKQDNTYNQTADAKARNKTVFWWILMLALKENDKGEFVQFFDGTKYEEMLKSYDAYEERDNDFEMLAVKYFLYLVSYLHRNDMSSTKEELDELVKDIQNGVV